MLLFRKDPISPAIQKLKAEDALKFLEYDRSQTGQGGILIVPFFNPHLLIKFMDRLDLQKRYFARLRKLAPCYIFNASAEPADKIRDRIFALIAGDEQAALK